ncbi:hypothetical protein KUCAC02_031535, partial [Chaenocephalus aceratus]
SNECRDYGRNVRKRGEAITVQCLLPSWIRLRAEDSSQRACSQRGIPKPVFKNRSMSRSDAPRNGNREKCARRNAHTDPTCPPYRARRKESRSDWQSC